MTDNPYKAPQSDVSTSPPAKSIRERLEERYGNEKDNAAKGMEFLVDAPSLMSFNGIGFGVYGRSNVDKELGTFIVTHYFMFLFIPLLPLRRYLVSKAGPRSYYFYASLPLSIYGKIHTVLGLAAIAAGVIYCCAMNAKPY